MYIVYAAVICAVHTVYLIHSNVLLIFADYEACIPEPYSADGKARET